MSKYGFVTEYVTVPRDRFFYTDNVQVPVQKRVKILASDATHYVVKPTDIVISNATKVPKQSVILEEKQNE